MALDTTSELLEFHRFVGEQLSAGGALLSPEEALDLWRDSQPADAEFVSNVAALKQALLEMDQGDQGRSLTEFDRSFRETHEIPPGA